MIDHAKEFNNNFEITLRDPVFQKEIEPLIKQFEDEKIKKEKAEVAANNMIGIIFGSLIALVLGAMAYENYRIEQNKKDYSQSPINFVKNL